MSTQDIRVKWYRATVQQTPDIIPVQLDSMSMQEAAYYGGEQPYFRYKAFINTTQYAFAFRDSLTDVDNVDPVTTTAVKYRIINDPRPSQLANIYALILDKVVGS